MKLLERLEIDYEVILGMILVIVLATIITRVLRWMMKKFFDSESVIINVDPTRYKFLMNAVSLLVWVLAFTIIIYTIPKFRAIAVTLFAGAGIFMAIMGFAAQAAFSNIISGIFIVVFKPFRVGDLIRVGQQLAGTVEDITLRHTVIVDFENRRIIIPNAVISSETVINSTIADNRICRHVEIGISYDSNIDAAINIMREEALKHPNVIDQRSDEQKANGDPQIRVKVINFGDSSVNLRAWVWAESADKGFHLHWDLNKNIKERFDQEGIEIPFPYRTLVFKKDIEQPKEKLNG